MEHVFVALFLLLKGPLYILVPPPRIFSCTFAPFGHTKHFRSHLPNASCHLPPRVVCIFPFFPRALRDNPSLKVFRRLPFEFPPLRSHDFVLFIPLVRKRKRKAATTSLCWETTHSPGITLQSKHVLLITELSSLTEHTLVRVRESSQS